MTVLTEFPFGAGVNEANSERMLPDGTLVECLNFEPGKNGELVTRRGYTALGTDVVGDDRALNAAQVVSYRGQLVALGNNNLTDGVRDVYVYHGAGGFDWRGQTQSLGEMAITTVSQVTEVWRAPRGIQGQEVEVAYAGGYLLVGYRDPNTLAGSFHVLTSDGRTVVSREVGSVSCVRCVGRGNKLIGISVANSTGAIAALAFDPTTDNEFGSSPTILANASTTTTDEKVDAAVITGSSTDFLIAYRNGTALVWSRWTSALVQVGSDVSVTDSNARFPSIQGHVDETINVVYRNNSTGNYTLRSYDPSGHALLAGPTTLTVPAGTSGGQAAIVRSGPGAPPEFLVAIRASDDIRAQLHCFLVDEDHSVLLDYTVREHVLTSKLFTMPAGSSGQMFNGGLGISHFGDFASHLWFAVFPDKLSFAQTRYGLAPPASATFLTSNQLGSVAEEVPSAATNVARTWYAGALILAAQDIGEGVNVGTPVIYRFVAGSEGPFQTIDFGGLLYIATGTLVVFDGRESVETGFPTPEIGSATASNGAGALEPQGGTAATVLTAPVDPPVAVLNGLVFGVSVDGGGFQTLVFGASDDDPTAIAATINAGTTGLTATVEGASVRITSDTTGTASSLAFGGNATVLAAFALQFFPVTVTGDVSPTVYRYRACHMWEDMQGNVHRSAPSPIVEVTMGATDDTVTLELQSPHTSRRNDTTANSGSVVQTEIYRTIANGTVFFLVDAVPATTLYAEALDYTDVTADDDIEERAVLYTQSVTVEENIMCEPCRFVAGGNDRVMIAGLPDPFEYRFSKLLLPEEPVNFPSPARSAYRGRVHEPITAIARDGARWLVFTARSPYEIVGEGPSVTGKGEFFAPRRLDAPGGAINERGVLVTDAGVFFQLDTDKLYLLKGQKFEWIGEKVQSTLAAFPDIRSAALLREQQLAVWACADVAGTDGRLLVLDITSNEWYVHDLGALVKSVAVYQGRLAVVMGSTVSLQDAAVGTTYGGDAAATSGKFRMGADREGQATGLGYGALHGVGLLGEYRGGTFTIELDISVDEGAFTEIGSVSFAPGTHTAGDVIRILKAPPVQRCEGFQLRWRVAGDAATHVILNSMVTETEKAYSWTRRGSAETF